MIYTEVGFRLTSGFKKIVLTQKSVLDLNQDSQKIITPKFPLPNVLYTCGRIPPDLRVNPLNFFEKVLG